MIDLRRFVGQVQEVVRSHELEPRGAFRRWNDSASHPGRPGGINPYGCADAANLLYTIHRFPRDPGERAGWVDALRSLQARDTGLFEEATHHPIHTTAHCLAALELFDAGPAVPLNGLAELREPGAMRAFLAELDWQGSPWRESHRGAGLYAALVIAGEVGLEWQDAYFAWLWDNTDPATGLLAGRDLQPVAHSDTLSMVPHMAGTFHYLFNMQYARRPSRFPDKLVESCLDMLADNRFPLGERIGFAEIDWIYCMSRSLRQCGHRLTEANAAVERLGQRLASFVLSLDPATDDALNDLHALFGTMCAFAELQQARPGFVRTDQPLRLVLDRRPFI